jgi:hypothetical protein
LTSGSTILEISYEGAIWGAREKRIGFIFVVFFFDISSSLCNAIENSNQPHNPCLPWRQNNHPFYAQLIVTAPSFAAPSNFFGTQIALALQCHTHKG